MMRREVWRVFHTKRLAAAGKDVKGSVEAESREEAARKIKEQGLVPVSIGKQGALDKDVNIPIFKGKKDTCKRHERIL